MSEYFEKTAADRARFSNMLFNETEELIRLIEARNLDATEIEVLGEVLLDFKHMRPPGEQGKKLARVSEAYKILNDEMDTVPRGAVPDSKS